MTAFLYLFVTFLVHKRFPYASTVLPFSIDVVIVVYVFAVKIIMLMMPLLFMHLLLLMSYCGDDAIVVNDVIVLDVVIAFVDAILC